MWMAQALIAPTLHGWWHPRPPRPSVTDASSRPHPRPPNRRPACGPPRQCARRSVGPTALAPCQAIRGSRQRNAAHRQPSPEHAITPIQVSKQTNRYIMVDLHSIQPPATNIRHANNRSA
jgi:hypothetical protein